MFRVGHGTWPIRCLTSAGWETSRAAHLLSVCPYHPMFPGHFNVFCVTSANFNHLFIVSRPPHVLNHIVVIYVNMMPYFWRFIELEKFFSAICILMQIENTSFQLSTLHSIINTSGKLSQRYFAASFSSQYINFKLMQVTFLPVFLKYSYSIFSSLHLFSNIFFISRDNRFTNLVRLYNIKLKFSKYFSSL